MVRQAKGLCRVPQLSPETGARCGSSASPDLWRGAQQWATGKSWLDNHSDAANSPVLDTRSHQLSFYRLR